MKPETSTQDKLDYLRGLAAIMVLLNHVRGAFYAGGERILAADPSIIDYVSIALLQITSFGTEAVVLFFVLSGFAMANSISLSSSTSRFYLKRALRIWPPYIAACLLAAAIGAAVGIEFDLLPKLFYFDAGGNPLTPQFWSLPYEIVFYALCPLILSSRQRVHWVFGLSALAFVATSVFGGLTLNPWPSFALNFLGHAMFLFSCGAMAFHHLPKVPKLPSHLFIASIVLALAIAWISKRWLGQVNAFSMVVIAAVSVLMIVNTRVIGRLNFGYFSYSLYVFHYALIALVVAMLLRFGIVGLDITNPVAWVPIAAAVGLVCWALYWSTERISNGWVQRLRRPVKSSDQPLRYEPGLQGIEERERACKVSSISG